MLTCIPWLIGHVLLEQEVVTVNRIPQGLVILLLCKHYVQGKSFLMSDSNKSTITPLFEKVLSASDAGRIGRLVLPKACAEASPLFQFSFIMFGIEEFHTNLYRPLPDCRRIFHKFLSRRVFR